MNPLLLLAGGGLAAYLLLRRKDAETTPSPSSAPTSPPVAYGTSDRAGPGASASQATTNGSRAPSIPKGPMTSSNPIAPDFLHPLPGRWVWPVPRWEGRAPVISDGFGSPRPGATHAGVDLMFTRIASDPFPPGSPNGSKLFVMPNAWMAVAASDGVLWSAGHTARGYAVVIDHGQAATFYTHLDALFVPITTPAKRGNPDHPVHIKAGQPLGVIGADPQDPARLKHLHFELWLGGPADAVDPKPIMSTWQVLTPGDIAPFLSSMTRNAKRREGNRPDLVHVTAYDRAWPGTALRPPR